MNCTVHDRRVVTPSAIASPLIPRTQKVTGSRVQASLGSKDNGEAHESVPTVESKGKSNNLWGWMALRPSGSDGSPLDNVQTKNSWVPRPSPPKRPSVALDWDFDQSRWDPLPHSSTLETAGSSSHIARPLRVDAALVKHYAQEATRTGGEAETIAKVLESDQHRLAEETMRLEELSARVESGNDLITSHDLLGSHAVPLITPPGWLSGMLGKVGARVGLDYPEVQELSHVLPEWDDAETHPATGTGEEILLQGFNWDSWRTEGGYYEMIGRRAKEIADLGFTLVWMPPFTDSVSQEGYMPRDLYDLNSKYGSKEQLRNAIKAFKGHGVRVLGDAVLNHRCAHEQDEHGIWNKFGGKLAWDQRAIVGNDPSFRGRGNKKSQMIWSGAPNVDHSQDFVQEDISSWMKWLRNEIGFDGWRLDFVRGIHGTHVKTYVEASLPHFCVGEFWDALDYDGSTPKHDQNAHRQRIVDWIDAAGTLSSAFDMTTKGILHAVFERNEYWRLRDSSGRAPGLLGWWPSRTVLFLENHDTGSSQGHWRFPHHGIQPGYAYILTHPGTPCVFYDHIDGESRPSIESLLRLRRSYGVHCRSAMEILVADNIMYCAIIEGKQGRIAVKIGHGEWSPGDGWNHEANGHLWSVWGRSDK